MSWLILVSGDQASLQSLVYCGIVLMMLFVILRHCGKAPLDGEKKDFSQIAWGSAVKI